MIGKTEYCNREYSKKVDWKFTDPNFATPIRFICGANQYMNCVFLLYDYLGSKNDARLIAVSKDTQFTELIDGENLEIAIDLNQYDIEKLHEKGSKSSSE